MSCCELQVPWKQIATALEPQRKESYLCIYIYIFLTTIIITIN